MTSEVPADELMIGDDEHAEHVKRDFLPAEHRMLMDDLKLKVEHVSFVMM
jgi:hypothetical protein